jgi:hypothetical protein
VGCLRCRMRAAAGRPSDLLSDACDTPDVASTRPAPAAAPPYSRKWVQRDGSLRTVSERGPGGNDLHVYL